MPKTPDARLDCLSAGILFADVASAAIAQIPPAGGLQESPRIQLGLGGCAANAALDLAKLGCNVAVSGCVGQDAFGRFIVETLSDGGVDTRSVRSIDDEGTACTMIVNVQGEDRRFICAVGANRRFAVEHIPLDWVRSCRVFYLGGFLMMPELETSEMVDLFREARAAGAKTVLDVVYLRADDTIEALARILPETDYFLPNDDESRLFLGIEEPLEQARAFRDMGAGTVVITRGEQGSVLVSDRLRLRAGVYPVDMLSGAGSGDAFDAGFIAGLLAGEESAGCLRWGSALGASAVRAISTTESVFTRAELDAFLAERELPIEEV